MARRTFVGYPTSRGGAAPAQDLRWCPGAELNHRHTDFQSVALPTELPGHGGGLIEMGARPVQRIPALHRGPLMSLDWARGRAQSEPHGGTARAADRGTRH